MSWYKVVSVRGEAIGLAAVADCVVLWMVESQSSMKVLRVTLVGEFIEHKR